MKNRKYKTDLFALDEAGHRKLGNKVKDKKTALFKIIDVASGVTLACEVGTGERYELFRMGLSKMLHKNGNILPAEFAFDKSPVKIRATFSSKKAKEKSYEK